MLNKEDIDMIRSLVKDEFKSNEMERSSGIKSGNCYNHLPGMSSLKSYMLDSLLPHMKSYDTYTVWNDIRRLILHVYKFNRMADLIDKPDEESAITKLGFKTVDDIKASLEESKGE